MRFVGIQGLALGLVSCVASPMVSSAQGPWTVALAATMNPLPIGGCAAIRLTLVDPATRDVPRNALGQRVTIADFDITLTTPNGTSAALQYLDAYNVSACGCQRAVPGTIATVTATYPARALDARTRVRGVAFEETATFKLSEPKGSSNPTACERLASAPIPQRPSTRETVEQTAPRAAARTPVVPTPVAIGPAPSRRDAATLTAPPSGPPNWQIILQPQLKPLPVGSCTLMDLYLKDRATSQPPKTPMGGPVRLADFDVTVSTPDGRSAAISRSPNENFQPELATVSACGCTGAPAGTVGMITATYPKQGLATERRVPGVAFQTQASLELTTGPPNANPSACVTLAAAAPAAPGAATVVRVNPSGFRAEQNAAQKAGKNVQLTWQPVLGATGYVLEGPGLHGSPEAKFYDPSAAKLVTSQLLPGTHEWTLRSIYGPNEASTPAAQYSRVTFTLTGPPVTPSRNITTRTFDVTGARGIRNITTRTFDVTGARGIRSITTRPLSITIQ